MITLPPQISDAERAVNAYKHELLVRVMAHIVRRALVQAHVSANDVPEDLIAPEHRQGVASNAWNALRALEIIEALPMSHTDPTNHIYAGRTRARNEHAKGRPIMVYRLASRARAVAWANANQVRLAEAEIQPALAGLQIELIVH